MLHWEACTISRGGWSLLERLRRRFPGADLSRYVEFYCERTGYRGLPPFTSCVAHYWHSPASLTTPAPCKLPYPHAAAGLRNYAWLNGTAVTEQVYVHSKLLIADDRLVIMGSANLNDRSQFGDRDSEIAALVTGGDRVITRMGGNPHRATVFAHTLRRNLMEEHTGLAHTCRHFSMTSGAPPGRTRVDNAHVPFVPMRQVAPQAKHVRAARAAAEVRAGGGTDAPPAVQPPRIVIGGPSFEPLPLASQEKSQASALNTDADAMAGAKTALVEALSPQRPYITPGLADEAGSAGQPTLASVDAQGMGSADGPAGTSGTAGAPTAQISSYPAGEMQAFPDASPSLTQQPTTTADIPHGLWRTPSQQQRQQQTAPHPPNPLADSSAAATSGDESGPHSGRVLSMPGMHVLQAAVGPTLIASPQPTAPGASRGESGAELAGHMATYGPEGGTDETCLVGGGDSTVDTGAKSGGGGEGTIDAGDLPAAWSAFAPTLQQALGEADRILTVVAGCASECACDVFSDPLSPALADVWASTAALNTRVFDSVFPDIMKDETKVRGNYAGSMRFRGPVSGAGLTKPPGPPRHRCLCFRSLIADHGAVAGHGRQARAAYGAAGGGDGPPDRVAERIPGARGPHHPPHGEGALAARQADAVII